MEDPQIAIAIAIEAGLAASIGGDEAWIAAGRWNDVDASFAPVEGPTELISANAAEDDGAPITGELRLDVVASAGGQPASAGAVGTDDADRTQ